MASLLPKYWSTHVFIIPHPIGCATLTTSRVYPFGSEMPNSNAFLHRCRAWGTIRWVSETPTLLGIEACRSLFSLVYIPFERPRLLRLLRCASRPTPPVKAHCLPSLQGLELYQPRQFRQLRTQAQAVQMCILPLAVSLIEAAQRAEC